MRKNYLLIRNSGEACEQDRQKIRMGRESSASQTFTMDLSLPTTGLPDVPAGHSTRFKSGYQIYDTGDVRGWPILSG